MLSIRTGRAQALTLRNNSRGCRPGKPAVPRGCLTTFANRGLTAHVRQQGAFVPRSPTGGLRPPLANRGLTPPARQQGAYAPRSPTGGLRPPLANRGLTPPARQQGAYAPRSPTGGF